MARNRPSPARTGHRTCDRWTTTNQAAATTEARNRTPVRVSGVGGRHSATVLRIRSSVRDGHDVPPHAEPERVEQGEGDRGEPDHEGPGRGPAPGVQVLRPGDREQDRGQEEAPVRVRPQDGDRQRPQDAVRMPVPAREQPLREGEPEDPEELGPDQEAAGQQDPRREREPGGRPARRADVAARRVEQPGDGRRDRRTERGEREPPADVEEPSEDDLRAPLLVQPRRAEGRAREHVAAQDGCRRPA